MKNWFICIAAALAMLGAQSCANAPKEKHTSFETLTIKRQTVTIPSRYSAVIQGRTDVSIMPQTSGQLMDVCVKVGQKVKKGDVMFRIDDRPAKNVLNARKADLTASQAQMESARLEYESNQNLFEKNIVSSYMLNTSLNDYNRAKAAVAQAEAAVSQAMLDLEFCTIFAPVDGLVGYIKNNPGDLVSPVTKLTTVSGTSEMKASFSVTESTLQNALETSGSIDNIINKMPPAKLILKNGSEYKYEGKVNGISGQIDRQTGSIVIETIFPNPEGALYSGIQGSVSFDITYEDVMVIPLSAVVRIQDKTLVYRVKDGCAESVVVEIEEGSQSNYAAVFSGLEEGDVIIAKGVNNVIDGMQVIFNEEEQKN